MHAKCFGPARFNLSKFLYSIHIIINHTVLKTRIKVYSRGLNVLSLIVLISRNFRKTIFDTVNWEKLRHSCTFEEFPAKLTQTVLNACLDSVPRKQFPSGKPKLYNAFRRKKSKLRVRLSAAKCTGDLVRIKELET